MPFYFQDGGKLADSVSRLPLETGTYLLFGSPAYQKDAAGLRYLNSAFLLSPAGTILGRSDKTHLVPFGEEAIPTGALSLDIALGEGGIPRGRITEVYGPDSSGKTTICQHIVAEAQRLGGTCAFVDMEHALDPAYAERWGVDIDSLLISGAE